MNRFIASLVMILFTVGPLQAAQIVRITDENYDQVVPAGKEVDAIVGDYALISDKLMAVVADPIEGRNANLTVKAVGGHLLDFTQRQKQNDQLSCWFAAPGIYGLRQAKIETATGAKVVLVCGGRGIAGQPDVIVKYTLEDGRDDLLIETTIANAGDKTLSLEAADEVRADKTFAVGIAPEGELGWVVDEWWNQAYGVMNAAAGKVASVKGGRPKFAYGSPDSKLKIEPGKSASFARRVICAANVLELRSLAAAANGKKPPPVTISISDPAGPVEGAIALIGDEPKPIGAGATDAKGELRFGLEAGEYPVRVVALGRSVNRGVLKVEQKGGALSIKLDSPGYVEGRITAESGGPIPCKVIFKGIDGTDDPFFFHETGEFAVHNIVYSPSGFFRQAIAPGKYDVTISYGPEYDAVFTRIAVERGKATPLPAKMKRAVSTLGYVSGEFHSHATPSGDNVSSQLGRVLNLLCEHLEFCPCTEHQRIDSYVPHLKKLGVEHLMATCTGMELTNQLPFNHQNVFPLIHRPRRQNGGGPVVDDNPVTQIERVAYWDGKSEKVVQENHPNMIRIAFDSDEDGKRDTQFSGMFKHMSVIEVHPIHTILDKPGAKDGVSNGSNKVVAWMQLLNQGIRVPGVANTDAHYNNHGSGWLRNWIVSSTDDPAKISVPEMVAECRKGHIIMSNGPFMEVTLSGSDSTVLPGDDLAYDGQQAMLHVKVQCANWLDINRVQVLINGRADPKYNYTRARNAKFFSDGAVKFDRNIGMKLEKDCHIIVAALGEGLDLKKVYPAGGGEKQVPCAVSNPIFVDVDGGGFKASGDDLGAALPQ